MKKFSSRLAFAGFIGLSAAALSRLAPEEILALSPLRCPLHTWFGIRCPTCGLGHSIAHALTGDWTRAFQAHLLGPIVLIGFAIWLLGWVFSIPTQPGKKYR